MTQALRLTLTPVRTALALKAKSFRGVERRLLGLDVRADRGARPDAASHQPQHLRDGGHPAGHAGSFLWLGLELRLSLAALVCRMSCTQGLRRDAAQATCPHGSGMVTKLIAVACGNRIESPRPER